MNPFSLLLNQENLDPFFFCETCGGNDGIIQPELRTCQVSESSGYVKIAIEAMAIEIVDLPINSMVIFYN